MKDPNIDTPHTEEEELMGESRMMNLKILATKYIHPI
jgi:hypothetical protein